MEIDNIIKPYLRALNRGTDMDSLIAIVLDENAGIHPNLDRDAIRGALLAATASSSGDEESHHLTKTGYQWVALSWIAP